MEIFIFIVFLCGVIILPILFGVMDKKSSFIFNRGAKSDDQALTEYIENYLRKNNLELETSTSEINKRKVFIVFILSVITTLDLSYIFVYHYNIAVAVIVEIAAIISTIVICKKMKAISVLKKRIKASPDDNMEYIIANFIENNTVKKDSPAYLVIIFLIVFSVVIPLIIFSKPRTIYERQDDGYVVRYHTLSVFGENKVSIPETYNGSNVIGIRGNVFMNLFYIKEINLPSTITEIRGSAFKNCYSLEKINLPVGITEIKGNTFENDRSLTSINIPEGVTRIGGHAFYGCYALSDVTIPSTVTEIGSSAFRLCSSLYIISIPRTANVNTRAFKESPTRITRY